MHPFLSVCRYDELAPSCLHAHLPSTWNFIPPKCSYDNNAPPTVYLGATTAAFQNPYSPLPLSSYHSFRTIICAISRKCRCLQHYSITKIHGGSIYSSIKALLNLHLLPHLNISTSIVYAVSSQQLLHKENCRPSVRAVSLDNSAPIIGALNISQFFSFILFFLFD